MKYPIAPNGIFATVQGEGVMAGEPMLFVRLAGCSVGCALCDTDYRVSRRLTAPEITAELRECRKSTYTNWVWITGGEPMDHDLLPLIEELREAGFNLTIATSGHKEVPPDFYLRYGCRLSVSPHVPSEWKQFIGDELKIVPGLAGHSLAEFLAAMEKQPMGFRSKWACPCEGKPETIQECKDFVMQNSGWRLGNQAHKQWGIP